MYVFDVLFLSSCVKHLLEQKLNFMKSFVIANDKIQHNNKLKSINLFSLRKVVFIDNFT